MRWVEFVLRWAERVAEELIEDITGSLVGLLIEHSGLVADMYAERLSRLTDERPIWLQSHGLDKWSWQLEHVCTA